LAADEATVPVGSVIIVACRDECSRKLTDSVREIFVNMGGKEISALQYRDGWLFMGVKGSKSHLEKRGGSVNAGMILGYSRVTKRTNTK
jgi:archaeosine-15-forming tRNA-guanine transglycosylase